MFLFALYILGRDMHTYKILYIQWFICIISDIWSPYYMYVHNAYVLYYTEDMYIQLDLCVYLCMCGIFFSWLDWSYRSEDCIFAILITLNISNQECTLSAWLNPMMQAMTTCWRNFSGFFLNCKVLIPLPTLCSLEGGHRVQPTLKEGN